MCEAILHLSIAIGAHDCAGIAGDEQRVLPAVLPTGADAVDRAFAEVGGGFGVQAVGGSGEHMQLLIVRAADDALPVVQHGDRIHQHTSGERRGLGEPARIGVGQMSQAHMPGIVDHRDIAAACAGDVVEAIVADGGVAGAEFGQETPIVRLPDQHGAVEGAGDHVLSIRRPVVGPFPLPRARFETQSVAEVVAVPDMDRLIVGGAEDRAIERRTRDFLDAGAMCGNRREDVAAENREHADAAVVAAQHHAPAMRIDRAGIGFGLERPPHPQRLAAVDVPDAQGLVVAGGIQMPVVGADAQHIALVAFDAVGDRAAVEIPQQDAPVARYRSAAMLADETEILDIVAVAEQSLDARAVAQIPKDDAVVGRYRCGAQSVSGDHDPVDQMVVVTEQGHRAGIQVEARHRAVIGGSDDLPGVRNPRGSGDRPAMATEIESRRRDVRSAGVCRRHR